MANFYNYTPGLGNVGSYNIAANPFLKSANLTGSATNNGEVCVSFEKVTRSITVVNRSTSAIYVHFASRANAAVINNGDYVILETVGDAWAFNVKTKEIYLSMRDSTGTASYSLSAELTSIPYTDIGSHSGSGVNV